MFRLYVDIHFFLKKSVDLLVKNLRLHHRSLSECTSVPPNIPGESQVHKNKRENRDPKKYLSLVKKSGINPNNANTMIWV